MSDTEKDISSLASLASQDDVNIVFPSDDGEEEEEESTEEEEEEEEEEEPEEEVEEGASGRRRAGRKKFKLFMLDSPQSPRSPRSPRTEEEEEEEYETVEEEDLLSPFPLSPRGTSTEGEGEERGPEEVIDNIFTPEGTPHLVIPEDADRSSVAVINIPVPERSPDDERRDSVASSYVSSYVDEDGIARRYSDVLAPRFSIRDAPGDEGVETNIGAEGQESARRPSTSLQPPTSRRSSRPSSRESSQRSDRSVSFSKDLKTTKSAAGTAAHKSSKKSEELPPKKSKKERKRPDSRSSRSSSHSRSPTPKRERKKKKRHHHRKRKSDDEEDGESGSRKRSKSKQKKSKKKHSKDHSRKKSDTKRKSSSSKKEHRSSRRESPSSRRKSKKKRDIAVKGVPQFSDIDASDVEYAPPKDMSPRSAAEYVRKKLKHDAAKRKKKRRRKKISGGGDVKTKKKKKRKGKRKRKRKRRTDGETSEEELTRPKQKPFKPEDQHFYPTPRNLFKKRCVFTAESKPVACTICDGFHYRTKRNFKENLKIIINVNKALTEILGQMRNRMKKIDTNLIRVKKNLEYMEDLYEGIFRKVNRLITSQDQSEEAQDHQIES